MAVIYCRSTDGSDADNGSTWALAKATLAAAVTAAGAGGTVYVSDNHAESTAGTKNISSPGGASDPVIILCVDDSGNPQPPTALASTATVTTTGANNISFSGFAYCYGITFTAGNSTSNGQIIFQSTSPWWWKFDNCALRLGGNNTSSRIAIGAVATTTDDQLLEMIKTSVQFANASQRIQMNAPLRWLGGSVTAGTAPTYLFYPFNTGNSPGIASEVRGVDISAVTIGYLGVGTSANFGEILFENCRLPSGITDYISGTAGNQGGHIVRARRCWYGDRNYSQYLSVFAGGTFDDTDYYRNGGANDGSTNYGIRMVTAGAGNVSTAIPLDSDPIVFWNNTVGSSITVTIHGYIDGFTPTDLQAWLNVEYLGTSGSSKTTITSDKGNPLGSGTAQTTDNDSTWTAAGFPIDPRKFKLSVTITPQEKGPIKCWVSLATTTTTMIIDPKPVVS